MSKSSLHWSLSFKILFKTTFQKLPFLHPPPTAGRLNQQNPESCRSGKLQGNPFINPKRLNWREKEKLVQQLLSFSNHISSAEYVLGRSEHKLTVIKCLQGLSPVFHQMYLLMNYCFQGKLGDLHLQSSTPGSLCSL